MPLRYKRLLKETKTYSIANAGKKKTLYSNYADSLPSKYELVDQIETNLKHLQGQKKILQNAKDGKKWNHKFSLNENRNNKNQEETFIRQCQSRCNVDCYQFCDVLRKFVGSKSVKVTDSYTQIGSSLNNLNEKRKCRRSPSRDLNKCKNKNLNFGQNVHLPINNDESSFNAESKISTKLSSARKVDPKTQINIPNQHCKRLLSEKEKTFMSENPFSQSKGCDTFKFITKLGDRSTPTEASYESHTFQNINKILPKVVEAKSVYTRNSKSPRNEKHTYVENMTLSPRSPKVDGQTPYRTESSIRRHAKLSREILDYTRWIRNQRISQKTNTKKTHRKKHRARELCSEDCNKSLQSSHEILTRDFEIAKPYRDFNQSKPNVSIYNHDTFIIVNPDGKKYFHKKEHRKDENDKGRSKNNNLTKNSCFSRSHTVNTVTKPINVIDDNTYVCPDNSEENNYLLLPYVGNTSDDNVNLNLSPKPEREHRNNLFDEITSKSIVVLEDISCQPPSKPRTSIKNERKVRANDSYHELQVKEGFFQSTVNQKINQTKHLSQRPDISAYMSHSLESTWESHANREGPLSSKFDTSHHNRIQILKPLTSDPYGPKQQLNDHNPIKLKPQMEQEKLMVPVTKLNKNTETSRWNSLQKQIINGASPSSQSIIHMPEKRFSIKSFSNNVQINNQAFPIKPERRDLKNNLLHVNLNSNVDEETRISVTEQSGKNEKLRESLKLDSYQISSEYGDTSYEIPVNTLKVEQKKELLKKNFKTPPLRKDELVKETFKTLQLQMLTNQESELGTISKISISMNPQMDTPKLRGLLTVKSPKKEDQFQQVTNDDNNLKNDNFEAIASSSLSLTPRQKFTSSDSEIQEKKFKQRRHTTQNYDDLISKSFNFKSGVVPRKDSCPCPNQPRLGELKNDFQHRCSLPIKENQLNLQTSQISKKNESAPIPNGSDLGAILKRRDSVQTSLLPDEIKEYETQDISRGPHAQSEPKMNASTQEIGLKNDPTLHSNALPDNQSIESKSNPNYELNDFELGAIPKMSSSDSFSLTTQSKEFGTQNSSRKHFEVVQKIDTVTVPFPYVPEQKSQENTPKANPTVYLKSGLKYDTDVRISPSFPSDSTSVKRKQYNEKSKLPSSISLSSFSTDFQSKSYESQNISQNPQRSEPNIHAFSEVSKNGTLKAYQSTEKNTSESKSFGSASNGLELGAIPKVYGNENNLTLRSLTNQSSLSLSAVPDIFKTQNLPQKSPQDSPELKNSTGRTSFTHKKSSQAEELVALDPNRSSNEELQFSTDCKKILSQQSLSKSNKSSSSQYLELFWNDNEAVKDIFRTSSAKFRQKSNFSKSSKSYQDLSNCEPDKILLSTSPTVFTSDKLEASENSGRSKLSLISSYSLKTEKTNTESIGAKIAKKEKYNIFNRIKPTTPASNMSLSFPRGEDLPSDNIGPELSNNQHENFNRQKYAIGRDTKRLNETKSNVISEKRVFLSDTFNQNNSVEGVSPEISDLLQHLNNRIKDCDENVKNQSEELKKLKKHCKEIGPLTSIETFEREDEPKKELLGNININEPLIREDISEYDIKEENSCPCLFCRKEESTSYSSGEIPSFSGCECMKEDYYTIMRIAYNK